MRVVLVDDHPALLVGLRDVLAEHGIDVVGEAGTVADAIELIVKEAPDVALVDLRLPDGDGASICRAVSARAADTRCVIYSAGEQLETIADAVAAGAIAFVYKGSEPRVVIEALSSAVRGERFFPDDLYERIVAALQEPRDTRVEELSDPEEAILGLLGDGRSNREIADTLGIAEKTVRNHVSVLLGKLRLRDRTQAALYAQRRHHRPSP